MIPRTWQELTMDIKAWMRGEYRIARGTRGRIYARRYEDSPSDMGTHLKLEGSVTPSRIWKAAENRWYTIDEYREQHKENS